MLSATPGGYVTVTNEKGLFALYIPYPPLADAANADSKPLPEFAWEFTFEVQYEPGAQQTILEDQPPTTDSIVGQAAGTVFETETGSGSSSLTRNLQYGRALVLSTDTTSRLLVEPASP
jgi:hypothetical protein